MGITDGASAKSGAVQRSGGAPLVIKSQMPPSDDETRYGGGRKCTPNPNLLGDTHSPQRIEKLSACEAPANRRPAVTASQRPSAGNGLPKSRSPGRRRGSLRYSTDKPQPWRVALPRSSARFFQGPGYAGQPHVKAHVCPHHTSQRQPRRTRGCKRSARTERRRQQPQVSPPVRKKA